MGYHMAGVAAVEACPAESGRRRIQHPFTGNGKQGKSLHFRHFEIERKTLAFCTLSASEPEGGQVV
jgi:hypothetical protein